MNAFFSGSRLRNFLKFSNFPLKVADDCSLLLGNFFHRQLVASDFD